MSYTCDPSKIIYMRTHRGIDAKATIFKDGQPVATLHDEAHKIVATVIFSDKGEKGKFLESARANGFKHVDESYCISEYARKIVHDAEQESLLVHS